ncbi:MAG: TonB-dependent receptor [Alphaproteobacteria bacterium]|nr:TonB-dependent receptor [Alphaproteobacteria bacterium]
MIYKRNLHVRSALFLSAALSAMAASAAQAQPATSTETIVVTGSRIPTTNATSVSPLSTATAAQISETSAFSVEDVLVKLTGPDNTGGVAKSTNNGGGGFSQIGLRNLGPSRTLVLVDGQRLIPGTQSGFNSSVPDLNSVPVSLVDRIEVLRDGASSIYGADAIGGVINIITKKDFEGLRFDGMAGTSEHGGADTYQISGTMGVNFDRGNVTFSLLNEKQGAVTGATRDWVQDAHIGQGALEGGTSYRTQLNMLQDATGANAVWFNGIPTTRRNAALATVQTCLQFLPNVSGGVNKLNANCGSIQPSATLQGSVGRTQASFTGHYDIMPDVTFVASGFFTRRNSEQRIRPEPVIGPSIASTYLPNGSPVYSGFQVPVYSDFGFASNAFLPLSSVVNCGGDSLSGGTAKCINANLTPNEFGTRTYSQTSDTYRIRIGLEGHVFTDYNWEVGYVQQRNDYNQHIYNSGNFFHFAQASANVPCLDVPGGCTTAPDPRFGYVIPKTPINFYNLSKITPDQLAYLKTTLNDSAYSYENYIYADVNGPVFDLPAGPVQAAVGVERRFEYGQTFSDNLGQEGYSASQSANTAGGYGTYSIYGELRVPILKDVPMFQSLTFTPSGRYDHYSTFGDATTYKLGADWQVIPDLRFRGSYNTGFRAPSVAELYGGRGISFIGVSGDPCDSRAKGFGGNANAGLGSLAPGSACATSLATIGVTGAALANYQSPENNLANDQRPFVVGGNPALSLEKSHSWTVGAVLTPTFLPGFSLNTDYYEITITNSILVGGIPLNLPNTDQFITDCFVAQVAGNCASISRNSGGIFNVLSLNANTGTAGTTGVDMEASFDTNAAGVELPFDIPGSVSLDAQAEHQITNFQNTLGSLNRFAGTYLGTSGYIQPKWKATLFADYHLADWGFHYDLQYIGGTDDAAGGTGYGFTLPDYVYHNISVSYNMAAWGPTKGSLISFGINNLLDKDPPFTIEDSVGKNNTISGPYDEVGRFLYMRFTVKL